MGLSVVGIGPGSEGDTTLRARETLERSDAVVCYTTYAELLPELDAEIITTGMGGEVERVERAVDLAADRAVALVSSGDPNVYALAGLALEVMEGRGVSPSALDFEVVPGVPAANSCAALLGAPLVDDYATVSLSDRLVPREEVEHRLAAVAPLDVAVVLYNPWSRGRRENYRRACDVLLQHRDPATLCGVVRDCGRDGETTRILPLSEVRELDGDPLLSMSTTIIVGREDTFEIEGLLVTPRGYGDRYDY
ncbi:MAG: Siroheme synthase [Methanonatronarchaeales archaeon]|nr:Siroheme synthase [Methanonatronarchaeales archaeon]